MLPLLKEGQSVLDYGCGYGYDVGCLKREGYKVTGYDPYFNRRLRVESDWVFLFYVLNCIEDPGEREAVLVDAYGWASFGLAIALAVLGRKEGQVLNDGHYTQRGTFWTDYTLPRARALIRAVLGVEPHLQDSLVFWLPVGYADPIMPYNISESERLELVEKTKDEIEELQRSPFIFGEDVGIQEYFTRGKLRYRLVSPSRCLRGGVNIQYAGTDRPSDWVVQGLAERDRLRILRDRLDYLSVCTGNSKLL
jgi:hypothetical protein